MENSIPKIKKKLTGEHFVSNEVVVRAVDDYFADSPKRSKDSVFHYKAKSFSPNSRKVPKKCEKSKSGKLNNLL